MIQKKKNKKVSSLENFMLDKKMEQFKLFYMEFEKCKLELFTPQKKSTPPNQPKKNFTMIVNQSSIKKLNHPVDV